MIYEHKLKLNSEVKTSQTTVGHSLTIQRSEQPAQIIEVLNREEERDS